MLPVMETVPWRSRPSAMAAGIEKVSVILASTEVAGTCGLQKRENALS